MNRTFLMSLAVISVTLAASGAADAAPRKRIGSVALVNGQVIILSGGVTFPAEPGSPLYEGDVVRSYNPGKAKIVFPDDSIINIGRDTEFKVRKAHFDLDKRESAFEFARGRFKVAVGKVFTASTNLFRVSTPTFVAGVRGTVFWGDTDLDAFCTLEGEVETYAVSNEGVKKSLTAGSCVAGMKGGAMNPISPTGEAVKGYIEEVTPE